MKKITWSWFLNNGYLGAHLHVHTTNQELKPWCYRSPGSPLTTESTTGSSAWKTSAQSSPDMLVWMWNFPAGKNVIWNQCASTKGIHFNKSPSSSKKQFAEKFLISSPDKLVDLISGSISQQWLRVSSLNCSGAPLCYIPHTHTHWNHRCVNTVLLRCSFLSWPAGLNLNYPLKLLNFAVNFICTYGN